MTLQTIDFPVFPADAMEQVSAAEMAQFAALIYARTGIRLSPQKKTLLSNRLRRRLRSTGIASFGKYYEHLKRLRAGDREWDAFLQEITTHETYFFRDENQWEWFCREFLAECASEAAAGRRRRRCGSGRRRAAPATNPSPPPAAWPPACPTSRNGTSASWAPTSASAPWSRPAAASSANAPCGWCRTTTAAASSPRPPTPPCGAPNRS